MEEDIKILEEYIEWVKREGVECCAMEKELPAIENLIKGYRELEKDLHEMYISNNHKKENWIHKNCLNVYIPKSKIKEKIEKLEKEFDFYAGREHTEWQDGEFDGDVCDDIALKIQVLKELMEDK